MSTYIVVGSSRGLGKAFAGELLENRSNYVIGIARTELKEIKNCENLIASGRYRHLRLDIASEDGSKILDKLPFELPKEPVCIIFNAAFIKTDVENDLRINFDNFKETNRVGIDGLGNVLKAFERHLLTYGGTIVGISSFSALKPQIFNSKLAYPASKAYLEMALRSLRLLWKKKVKVIIYRLGHLRGLEDGNHNILSGTYEAAARKLLKALLKKSVPDEIGYPILYNLFYKYLFALFSDNHYSKILKGFISRVKINHER